MSDNNQESAAAAVDALAVAADSLSIAREAELEKSAAEDRAKVAEAKLVTLEKVAKNHAQAVDDIVAFLKQEGYIEAANQEKFASEFKQDPSMGFSLIKRIVNLSAPPYDEGGGIPKSATEVDDFDPEARERSLWEKMATEGA